MDTVLSTTPYGPTCSCQTPKAYEPVTEQPTFPTLSSTLLLFTHSVMSSSLRPHGLQHARLPCPSLSPMIPSNHLILRHLLLLLPSIFPSIRVFSSESVPRIRWPKYWSFSLKAVLPMNIQGSLPLGSTSLIFLQFKAFSRVFSSTTI